MKWRSGKGRCLVATRDIKPMELIMMDAAIAHGPQNLTSPVCLECCKVVDGSYTCGMCNMPLCGEACQVLCTTKILETPMSTQRNKCGVRRIVQGLVAGDLVWKELG